MERREERLERGDKPLRKFTDAGRPPEPAAVTGTAVALHWRWQVGSYMNDSEFSYHFCQCACMAMPGHSRLPVRARARVTRVVLPVAVDTLNY